MSKLAQTPGAEFFSQLLQYIPDTSEMTFSLWCYVEDWHLSLWDEENGASTTKNIGVYLVQNASGQEIGGGM